MRGPRQRRFEAIWKPIFERECPLLYDENDESIDGLSPPEAEDDADNSDAVSEEERYSQASPADHTHSEVGAVETTVSPTTMHAAADHAEHQADNSDPLLEDECYSQTSSADFDYSEPPERLGPDWNYIASYYKSDFMPTVNLQFVIFYCSGRNPVRGVAILCPAKYPPNLYPLTSAKRDCQTILQCDEGSFKWAEPRGDSLRVRLMQCLFHHEGIADKLLELWEDELWNFGALRCPRAEGVWDRRQRISQGIPIVALGVGRNYKTIDRTCHLALLAAARIWMPFREQWQYTENDFVSHVRASVNWWIW